MRPLQMSVGKGGGKREIKPTKCFTSFLMQMGGGMGEMSRQMDWGDVCEAKETSGGDGEGFMAID